MRNQWIKVVERRGQSVLISSYFYNGIQAKYFYKAFGAHCGLDHYLIIDYRNYYLQSEVASCQRIMGTLFRRTNFRFLQKALDALTATGEDLFSYSQQIKFSSSKDLEEGVELYFKTFSDLCLALGPAMYFPILIEHQIENEVMRIIKKRVSENHEHYFDIFTRSARPTEGTYELISLFELARYYYNNGETAYLRKMVTKHLERFNWLSFTKFVGRPWTCKDIVKRIRKIPKQSVALRLGELRQEYTRRQSEVRKLLKRFAFTKQEQMFIGSVQFLTYFRTWRIDVYTQAGYNVKNLFSVIAQRLGLSAQDLMFLTYKEIEHYLRTKRRFSKRIVQKRMHQRWQLNFAKGRMSFSHKNFIKVNDTYGRTSELLGQAASPGHARGLVCIIRGVLEFNKMKPGAILITSMTTPDFVPLMQQSSAIVTDEGGITCHAAIVSRELGIPCVIGTKIATQVFKDGDRVEVDAIKGTVRKI